MNLKKILRMTLTTRIFLVLNAVVISLVIILIYTQSYLYSNQSKKMAENYLEAITQGATETIDCFRNNL